MPVILIAVLVLAAIVIFEESALAKGPDTSGQYSPGIVAFAKAIARAEGFGVPNAIPTLANNPGDLVLPGWTGEKLGSGISKFSTINDGWDRLYRQLQLIVNGASVNYTLSDTIQSMAGKYTRTDPTTWALIVSSELGVSASTPLSEVLGG
jgi:hypothetical protein